ncbi:hypothetical protein RI367_003389 [Sorochytrium milnesiophthora]
MDYQEEQTNEIEALKSIFFEEYIDLGDNAFAIEIRPDDDCYSHITFDESRVVRRTCILYVKLRYTEQYPDSAPSIDLVLERPAGVASEEDGGANGHHDKQDREEDEEEDNDEDGDDDDVDYSNHYLALDDADMQELKTYVDTLVQENMGTAMVFTIVQALKERLAEDVRRKQQVHTEAEEARIRKEEEEELKRFQGTRVTAERFLEWKVMFDREMAELEQRRLDAEAHATRATKLGRATKLTGRQLFESDKSMVNSDAGFIADDDESVDLSLFEQEVGAIDISDDEDDEHDTVANMLLQGDAE